MKTITEIRSSLSALLASWHARGDYADQETIKAMTDNLKGALKAWEAADAEHGGETQWAVSAHDYLERLKARLANPPATSVKPVIVDNRPTKWGRIDAYERALAKERAYLAKKGDAA